MDENIKNEVTEESTTTETKKVEIVAPAVKEKMKKLSPLKFTSSSVKKDGESSSDFRKRKNEQKRLRQGR